MKFQPFAMGPSKDGVETKIFRQIRNAESEIRNIFEIRNSEIWNFAKMSKPFLITFRSKITILKVKMTTFEVKMAILKVVIG